MKDEKSLQMSVEDLKIIYQLSADFKAFNTQIFPNFILKYTQDTKDTKDNFEKTLVPIVSQVNKHEERIQAIELIVTKTNPIQTIQEFYTLKAEVHDRNVRWNTYQVILGFIGAAIMFILLQVPNLLKNWGVIAK